MKNTFTSEINQTEYACLAVRVKALIVDTVVLFFFLLYETFLNSFLVRSTLGWISLLTIEGNDQRKALHDMLVGNLVVR